MRKFTRWEHGKVLKSMSFFGYRFTQTAYASEFLLPAHSHDFVYFCGSYEFQVGKHFGFTSRYCSLWR